MSMISGGLVAKKVRSWLLNKHRGHIFVISGAGVVFKSDVEQNPIMYKILLPQKILSNFDLKF